MNEFYSTYINTEKNVSIYLCSNYKFESLKNKRVVLFNDGLACDFLHWSHQIKILSENKIPFILHQYRGHFLSAKGDGETDHISIAGIVRDIAHFLKVLKVAQVAVIGHSMGVNISLNLAASHPLLLDSLTLISGSAILPYQQFKSRQLRHLLHLLQRGNEKIPFLAQMVWDYINSPLARLAIWVGGFNVLKVDMAYIEEYLSHVKELGASVFLKMFKELEEDVQRMNSYLGQIEHPALVLIGEKDLVIPPRFQKEKFGRLKNGRLVFLKDAGHVPQNEEFQLVNDSILNFLAETGPRSITPIPRPTRSTREKK